MHYQTTNLPGGTYVLRREADDLLKTQSTPLYKMGGFFVFSNLVTQDLQLKLAGRRFQTRLLNVDMANLQPPPQPNTPPENKLTANVYTRLEMRDGHEAAGRIDLGARPDRVLAASD